MPAAIAPQYVRAVPRPNWFLGFPLDGVFVRGLPKPPGAFRLFHPDDVHVTLAFLGRCDEPRALRALAWLEAELQAAPLRPLSISLGQVVPMGGQRKYTALSALLNRGRDEVSAQLVAREGPLIEIATGRRPKREPKPHVSIARPRHGATDVDREAGLAWAATLDLANVEATLDRIALYTWDERRAERLFKIVAERRLLDYGVVGERGDPK